LAGGLFFRRDKTFKKGLKRAFKGLLGAFKDKAFKEYLRRAFKGSLSVFRGKRLLAFLTDWLDLLFFRRPFRGFDFKSLLGLGVFVLLWFAF
jgi:hypothetical protein